MTIHFFPLFYLKIFVHTMFGLASLHFTSIIHHLFHWNVCTISIHISCTCVRVCRRTSASKCTCPHPHTSKISVWDDLRLKIQKHYKLCFGISIWKFYTICLNATSEYQCILYNQTLDPIQKTMIENKIHSQIKLKCRKGVILRPAWVDKTEKKTERIFSIFEKPCQTNSWPHNGIIYN